jgi:hypothetical protein
MCVLSTVGGGWPRVSARFVCTAGEVCVSGGVYLLVMEKSQ